MLPKTPIAWRRRAAPSIPSTAFVDIALAISFADIRVRALEAWAWGGCGKAPAAMQAWIDSEIAAVVRSMPADKAGA